MGGPRGGAPAGVPRGRCNRVNNSSTHKARYCSVHQPWAGDGGGRLVLSPPFFFLSEREQEEQKGNQKPLAVSAGCAGSAGCSQGPQHVSH